MNIKIYLVKLYCGKNLISRGRVQLFFLLFVGNYKSKHLKESNILETWAQFYSTNCKTVIMLLLFNMIPKDYNKLMSHNYSERTK